MKKTKYFVAGLTFMVVFIACFLFNQHPSPKTHQTPKGELAFLLQYNHRLPSDVGFLTNHVVERRLANLMKDDFLPFLQMEKFETPIEVDTNICSITEIYLKDTLSKKVAAEILIATVPDVIWVVYLPLDSTKSYSEYPGMKKPGIR